MKKIISILLSAIMIFSVCVPAFAAEEPEAAAETADYPVILIRGMDFLGLYVDYGTENQRPAVDIDAGKIVKYVFKALGSGLIHFNFDYTIDVILEAAEEILGGISVNADGSSKYNVGMPVYPEAAGNYEDLRSGTSNEFGLARTCIEQLGGDNIYYFNYDWRRSPLDVADDINATIERALAETGKDKVSIVCCSMGGAMTMGYLTKYGYDKIDRCIFLSSTFCGAQVASDVLNGRVRITADNLYNYLANLVKSKPVVKALLKGLKFIGAFKLVEKLSDFIIDNYRDKVYEEFLGPMMGHMYSLWALVQPEDYDSAVQYMFGDSLEENAEFIENTKKLQDMMAGRNELLYEMLDNGVKIAVITGYDSPVVPVYEHSDFSGDTILETKQMSGYATVAKLYETLGDGYVPKDPKYLSPDNVIDLSTAILPEYTYAVKYGPHVGCDYGTDYCDFLIWLLTYDGDEFYAGVNPRYPQFMLSGDGMPLNSF